MIAGVTRIDGTGDETSLYAGRNPLSRDGTRLFFDEREAATRPIPNGRWVAYTSSSDGRDQIYVLVSVPRCGRRDGALEPGPRRRDRGS